MLLGTVLLCPGRSGSLQLLLGLALTLLAVSQQGWVDFCLPGTFLVAGFGVRIRKMPGASVNIGGLGINQMAVDNSCPRIALLAGIPTESWRDLGWKGP